MSNGRWYPDSARTRAYMALREAMPRGASMRDLEAALPGIVPRTLHNAVYEMVSDGYLEKTPYGGCFRVAEDSALPPLAHDALRRIVMQALRDMPGGASAAQIAQDSGVHGAALDAALDALARVGAVERFAMPARHGGGSGWRVPQADDDGEGGAPGDAGGGPRDALPLVELDIDAVHRGAPPLRAPARFDVAGGSLRITWAGAQVKLPRDVTRQLFAQLDSLAVPRLRGLCAAADADAGGAS